MKKLNHLITLSLLFITASYGQVSLTYTQHGLLPDKSNPMKLTKYVEPGESGANQIWDFASLELVSDFEGQVSETAYSPFMIEFPTSNVELTEFNNHFYFELTETNLKQTGYASNDGKLLIKYEEPFIKMKYPFSFGNKYSGTFSGTYTSSAEAKINGTYSVEADGYGKLILPDGQVIKNTLRVKELKEYTRTFSSRSDRIKITTYRWYNDTERFPLLVLTEISTNDQHKSHQAAYRTRIGTTEISNANQSFNASESISVFPNPVQNEFKINYIVESEGQVVIDLFDNSGKKIANLIHLDQMPGEYEFGFSASDFNLQNGNYLVSISNNDKVRTTQLIVNH